MSPEAIIGGFLVAVTCLWGTATAVFDWWNRRRNRRRWQQTTAEAARRTEDDVRRDLAEARAALDLTECIAIWTVTKHDIPHQTRRTEEDQ